MTTKPELLAPPPDAPLAQFPDFPPRDDMQNSVILDEPGHQTALRRHLGHSGSIIVLSEAPLGWNTSQRLGLLIPDLLVAFGVDWNALLIDKGYSIDRHGKPPDFVLEIASATTGQRDETDKRIGYATYGVLEYWRFDDSDGQYHRTRLAGDRLVNGQYQPISIIEVGHARYWGYSAALNLYLCWEYGYLRWYDPVARRYLPTHDEEADGRSNAEAALVNAETALLDAETARVSERAARIAAETERDDALARAERLEAELRRLRAS